MSLRQATVVQVADITPLPWRNGGGMTRELLAWPDPQDWTLRVSVADITASGPFSTFAGVDRWFAVLSGGAVRLTTVGAEPSELTAARETLHTFAGDAATYCTAEGPATRDFNLMIRRARARLRQQPIQHSAVLRTRADCAGLFVAGPVALHQESQPVLLLPAMALAWWPNPERELRSLRVESTRARGWWFEVDTDL
jgi:hypothetical protein